MNNPINPAPGQAPVVAGIQLLLPDEPIARPPIQRGYGAHRDRLEIPYETTMQYVRRVVSNWTLNVLGFCNMTLERIGGYVSGWFQTEPLPNFAEVRPIHLSVLQRYSPFLYRGGQPLPSGYQALRQQGIKTVINLTLFEDGKEHARINGLNYHHIPMQSGNPRDEDVIAFLKIMNHLDTHPVFIHCKTGSEKTGFMIAVYRIVFQGFEKETAISEMVKSPFGFNRYLYWPLVKYINEMDPECLLREACRQARPN